MSANFGKSESHVPRLQERGTVVQTWNPAIAQELFFIHLPKKDPLLGRIIQPEPLDRPTSNRGWLARLLLGA